MADILLTVFLFYQVYRLIEGSMATRIFIGLLWLYLLYLVVKALEMELLTNILGQFMEVSILIAVILFQQEVRKLLFLIGGIASWSNHKLLRLIPWHRQWRKPEFNITPIVEAAKVLGGSNIGALIAFSKSEDLKFYEESGDLIDAIVSKRLLMAIFNKQSPLHDGGVIIYNNKVVAARCIFPVTEKQLLPTQFGLRHRAAIGMTEVTDTLVLVVSEETGQISVARNGTITRNLSIQEIRASINEYLHGK